jgi:hypothetical protein
MGFDFERLESKRREKGNGGDRVNQSGHSFWRERREIWRGHKSLTRGIKYISIYLYILKLGVLSTVSCPKILNSRKNYLG